MDDLRAAAPRMQGGLGLGDGFELPFRGLGFRGLGFRVDRTIEPLQNF